MVPRKTPSPGPWVIVPEVQIEGFIVTSLNYPQRLSKASLGELSKVLTEAAYMLNWNVVNRIVREATFTTCYGGPVIGNLKS
jgi:hypothetical protein